MSERLVATGSRFQRRDRRESHSGRRASRRPARAGPFPEFVSRSPDEGDLRAFKLATGGNPGCRRRPASRWPGASRPRDDVDISPAWRPSPQGSRGTISSRSGRDDVVLARSSVRTAPKAARASGPAMDRTTFDGLSPTRSRRDGAFGVRLPVGRQSLKTPFFERPAVLEVIGKRRGLA